MPDYRAVSLWLDTAGESLEPRAALPGHVAVDVAIIGAGYTGLWLAYYLAKAAPTLRIAIVEKDIAGFGASGRNGGWCSALLPSARAIARRHGRDAALETQRAMIATVDEVGRVVAEEGIEAQFHKGGTLIAATSPTQVERVRDLIDEKHAWGDPDYVWLSADETRARINVASCYGGAFTPNCARVHPARLVRGLARVVESLGVSIYERTPATAIAPGSVRTTRGTVTADVVVRATEGYTTALPSAKRALAPLYSLMIATEPLPEETWDGIGWHGRETFADGRHLLIYAQRTSDGRIAIGGRGAPYHFASRVRPEFDHEPKVFDELHKIMRSLWPPAAGARITHRWGGPLGVPRDLHSSVGLNRRSGTAWAGGYVGDGVAAANLAGRMLTDLILERDTELTRLPWVYHRSRSWEPEPLRWVGINTGLRVLAAADAIERRRGRPLRRPVEVVHRVLGL